MDHSSRTSSSGPADGEAARTRSPIFADLDCYAREPRVSGLQLSPDGTRVVATVSTRHPSKNRYVSSIWELDPDAQRPARRLTRSEAGESSPAFTPANDLYFLSTRPEAAGGPERDESDAALWCLPREGGEPQCTASRLGGFDGLQAVPSPAVASAPDSGSLVAIGPRLPGAADEQDHTRMLRARREKSVTAILHDGYPVRFWDHDLGPGRPHAFAVDTSAPITDHSPVHRDDDGDEDDAAGQLHRDGTDREDARTALRDLTAGLGASFTGEIAVSPDGRRAIVQTLVPEGRAVVRSALQLVDIPSGSRRLLLDVPGHDCSPGPISPDGSTAVIRISRHGTASTATQPQLHRLDLDSGEHSPLAADADLWFAPQAWLPGSAEILATADQRGRGPVFSIDVRTGAATQLTHDDATYSSVQVHPAGRYAFALRTSYAFPPEAVRIDLTDGTSQALPGPAERPELPGTLTEVSTRAEDGTPLRAWLALPESACDSDPAPLLLWVHGGPLSSWNAWSWRWNPWIMVARGYAVLLPDPALSTGYGQDFVQRGWNSWGDKPYTDLMAITDATEERSDIDASRTAAMGGSFGGYMANWIAGHTDRFSAIVTHASLWSLDQFGPTTDHAAHWAREIDERMKELHSPHRHVGRITTPMLVIHGDKDYRVPIGEGLRLWYELLSASGLPAADDGSTAHRFLYFPDENHWILTPEHAKVWYETVLGYLEQHVLGGEPHRPAELGVGG